MSDFEKGDTVQCVNNDKYKARLTVGKLYKLIENTIGWGVNLLDDKGEYHYFGSARFTSVVQIPVAPPVGQAKTDCHKCGGSGLISRSCGVCGVQWGHKL